MPDYSSHSDTLLALGRCQDAETDMRKYAREAHHFIDKRNGQWEQFWFDRNKGKPRYTFDQVGPQIDNIVGEMEKADFNITVKPAGGNATKEDAKLLDGLVRSIEQLSGATDIFNLAARNMVTAGLDGWRLEHKFVDDDSFDQDLVISQVANWIDSAWLGPHKKPDGSDAPYGFLLEAIPTEEYKERWPKGSGMSVSENRLGEAYYHKAEVIIVGQFYFIKEIPRELLLMSSGRVLERTPKNQLILDELQMKGETIKDERTIKKHVVYSRLFDGKNWLGPAERTVFSTVPLIPAYANFKITENKIIYRGHVEKLIDPQRVLNYAKSREVAEGALAPREKIWMSRDQAAGEEATLATLNVNDDPVQFYTPDPRINNGGPPVKTNGATINSGLNQLSGDMSAMIQQSGNQYDASMGASPNQQSGVAIKRLKNAADTGDVKYFSSMERAIARTGRMIVDAIPETYDTPRQQRILKEDGSFDQVFLNQTERDETTGMLVTVNDVSKGKYAVTCSAGAAFQNRQEEAVEGLTSMAAVDPTILQLAGDVLFQNMTAPGMDLVAERKRKEIFEAGLLPEDQLTEEEQAIMAKAQQDAIDNPPPEDPMMVAAQAEASKARADEMLVMVRAEAVRRQEDRKDWEAENKAQADRFDRLMSLQTGVIDQVNTQAQTLKLISDALGIPAATQTGLIALERQSRDVIEAQAEVQ